MIEDIPTKLPVLGVERRGICPRDGGEERPKHQIGIREYDVGEHLESAFVRCCFAAYRLSRAHHYDA